MKKIYLGILLSLMVVLMAGIGMASPACTFDQSADSYIRGGSANLSILLSGTWANSGDNSTIGNISVNTGTITGALRYNLSSNVTYMNFTIGTKALSDDTTYTFTVKVQNESIDTIATCTQTIKIDNTKPVITLVSPADLSKDTDGSISYELTCVNTSSATLTVDSTDYSMTESSDSCTYTLITPTNSFHSWYIIASDGLNTTTSATYQVEVKKPGSAVAQPQLPSTSPLAESLNLKVSPMQFINDIFQGIFDFIGSLFRRG